MILPTFSCSGMLIINNQRKICVAMMRPGVAMPQRGRVCLSDFSQGALKSSIGTLFLKLVGRRATIGALVNELLPNKICPTLR